MKRDNKTNVILDNAVQGLNHARDIYSRLVEITRLMPLIKDKSELVREDPRSHDSLTYCDGFLDGYNSRIESVWHDATEKPEKNDVHIAIYNKFGIKTDFWYDFGGWEKYVRLNKIIKWAYIQDLIPNKEE